jgi:hypothetical protein
MKWALWLLFCAVAARGQDAPEQGPVLAVDLLFQDQGVQIEAMRPVTADVPHFHGFAAGYPLFIEARGDKGQVLYAAALRDPRVKFLAAIGPEGRGKPPVEYLGLNQGRCTVYVPADGTRSVRVCRRSRETKQRTVLTERPR